MTVDLNNDAPIDETSPDTASWLAKLQGNILRSHGRARSVCILFSLGIDRAQAATGLAGLARRYVTSALRQFQDAQNHRQFGVPGPLFGSLVLSASGYRALGYHPGRLFPEPREAGGPAAAFADGMKLKAVADFKDPPVTAWQAPYAGDIDAMLLLADDDGAHLLRTTSRALDRIAQFGQVCAVEHGQMLRNDEGRPIEHFGFVDGISQPLYLRSDFTYGADGQPVADRNGSPLASWDPFEPLRRVLVRDTGVGDPEAHGSFLVFRKLEQDVAGFRRREAELATVLAARGYDSSVAAALIVGRFRNGAPIALTAQETAALASANDFQYAADYLGNMCPHFAHIRKVNPRGDALRRQRLPDNLTESERQRRITRRGIPYGSRESSKDVGLLFMCFQASIRRQFAFIQRAWVNDQAFVMGLTGVDPVIGQGATIPQRWPTGYGSTDYVEFPFRDVVTMRGGEYFFAPSLPFFASLGLRR